MSDTPNHEHDDTVRKLYAETQKRKERNRALAAELNNLKTQFEKTLAERESIAKELETYKAQPNELKAQYDALKGELRGIKHKEVFGKVAKNLKVRDEALDDLYKLTGYTPETDDPDETAISALLEEAVKARPYLVHQEEQQQPEPAKMTPSPAAARGGDPRLKTGFSVRRSELGKIPTSPFAPQYMAALKDGTLTILEG